MDHATPTANPYLIMGYSVEFPQGKRPFPAQFAVMNKVLTALKTEQHALLESPTGSGKTLALLCSTLTFQKQYFKDQMAAQMLRQQDVKWKEQEAKKQALKAQVKALETRMQLLEAQQQLESARKLRQIDETPLKTVEESEDEAIEATQCSSLKTTRKRESDTDSSATIKKRVLPPSFALATLETDTKNELIDVKVELKRVVPPCIFFCSRTHSQLTQVVQELKNCPVSYLASPQEGQQLQTCVLGSKRNMCVNRNVNRDPSQVDEKCRLALEGAKCLYFKKRKRVNDLKRLTPSVWDIEDLVRLAQKHRECAYFHAREALENAHIVFAPYNYLLDPTIRHAVGIKLKNAIIILDEAHNVEDTCRSSASVEISMEVLEASIKAFTIVIKHGNRPKSYNALLKVLNGVHRWLHCVETNAHSILQSSNYEEKSKVWDGADALAMLAEYSCVTSDNVGEMIENVQEVREYENELANTASQQPQTASQDAAANQTGASVLLGALALTTVQSLMNVVDYMFRNQLKFIDDFKLVVIKSKSTWRANANFRSPTKYKDEEWDLKLCIWCLNAAVAFSDLASQARSVVLTSGTLSPMDSFAGELGVDFAIHLEANHVVNMRKQVLIGTIMHGPGNVDLQSTYDNQQDPRYQDSMGQLLLQYSQAIPGGILMFFPSYSLLNKVTVRWKKTNVWSDIEQWKEIYAEPRNAGKDFDSILLQYRDAVTCSATQDDDGKKASNTGAIFLAVYRGKVSEGIDFSNENARAVLCVGIPFPNVKELQVSLKRKYQDERSRFDMKIVNGSKWYNLQAFRALNQALGRCIRHRKDYGAILLLDSRHRMNKHSQFLSKWMRPHIKEYEHSQMCVPMFIDFFRRNRMELPHLMSLSSPELASFEEKPQRSSPVLKYELEVETIEKAVSTKELAVFNQGSSLSSTVKGCLAKQNQGLDPHDSFFSIFRTLKNPPK
ncbi:hypothetical protein CCR75_003006 [Bremia lactucae]|uniref:Helicase ATP-binding domain-containing protein n=1 Tax=Bremia lactucae TaxID=4779 RepID=A0A976FFG7_BRELC|nr:hypothetical protein CCR75_003006 [Bremia lactucae]